MTRKKKTQTRTHHNRWMKTTTTTKKKRRTQQLPRLIKWNELLFGCVVTHFLENIHSKQWIGSCINAFDGEWCVRIFILLLLFAKRNELTNRNCVWLEFANFHRYAKRQFLNKKNFLIAFEENHGQTIKLNNYALPTPPSRARHSFCLRKIACSLHWTLSAAVILHHKWARPMENKPEHMIQCLYYFENNCVTFAKIRL